jgi:hypothetical protein
MMGPALPVRRSIGWFNAGQPAFTAGGIHFMLPRVPWFCITLMHGNLSGGAR